MAQSTAPIAFYRTGQNIMTWEIKQNYTFVNYYKDDDDENVKIFTIKMSNEKNFLKKI